MNNENYQTVADLSQWVDLAKLSDLMDDRAEDYLNGVKVGLESLVKTLLIGYAEREEGCDIVLPDMSIDDVLLLNRFAEALTHKNGSHE